MADIAFGTNGIQLKNATGEEVSAEDAVNVIVTGSAVEITKPADKEIHISGTCEDGQIIVNVDKATYPEGKVELSLEDLKLNSVSSSAIFVKAIGDECVISPKKGTENELSDTKGSEYQAAVYAEDDLKIKGKGELKVTGNELYGIYCKNDLKVYNGTLFVKAVSIGLKGKDSIKFGDKDDTDFKNLKVYVENTNKAYTDLGEKDVAKQEKDTTAIAGAQFIVNGGTIAVTSAAVGCYAKDTMCVSGGSISIVSSAKSAMETNKGDLVVSGGSIVIDAKKTGINAGKNLIIAGGTIRVNVKDNTGMKAGESKDGFTGDVLISGGKTTLVIGENATGVGAKNLTMTKGELSISGSDTPLSSGIEKEIAAEAVCTVNGVEE